MATKLLTSRITSLLIGAIFVTIITVAGALLWIASEIDSQAVASSRASIADRYQAIQNEIGVTAVDFEDIWDYADAGDDEWVETNFGSAVTEKNIVDLIVIVPDHDPVRYGWRTGMDEEPDPALLPTSIVQRMVAPLSEDTEHTGHVVKLGDKEAKVGLFKLGDELVLLAAVRIGHLEDGDRLEMVESGRIPEDGFAEIDAAGEPTIIVGYFLSPKRVATIGIGTPVSDLTLSVIRDPSKQWLPLNGVEAQELAYFQWTPPHPGFALLTRTALPIGAALVVFAILGFTTASRARGAAENLAASEKEAIEIARTDSLSGLPNRLSFTERLSSPAIQCAARSKQLAVIFADVNGFKIVNDTIGHAGGDRVLQDLADRFGSVLPSDAFLARVGGDEFNVLVTDRYSRITADALAKRMLNALDEEFVVNGASFRLSASIGFATSEGDGIAVEEVVRRADVAMYRLKEDHASGPIAYDPSFESGAAEKLEIEQALRVGMQSGELTVVYQPIAEARTNKVVAVEALLRWNSAQLGPVSPTVFIPIAEEFGLISDIGTFVLRQACADLACWQGMRVNINVSPVQLYEPRFVENLTSIVDAAGVDPRRIEIELTEGIIVSHPELARRKLLQLKEVGFTIALDDFGTGFSSIGYLRQLPFDKLKIDRSFVSGVGTSDMANSLLQSLVTLGDALQLTVVAEGVETKEQAELIKIVGCELMQGFYFAKPMPISELQARFGHEHIARSASVA